MAQIGRRGASLGTVAVVAALGVAAPTAAAEELRPASGPSDPGGPAVETATNTDTLFYDAGKRAKLRYRVDDSGPVSVRIELYRDGAARPAQSWTPAPITGDAEREVEWNGELGSGVAREGPLPVPAHGDRS